MNVGSPILRAKIPINPLRACGIGENVSFVVPEDRVRILPEHEATTENRLPARLIGEEFVGANIRLYAEAGSQQEIRLLTPHSVRSDRANLPNHVALTWAPDDAYVLPE